jgi:hypothetical protein
MSGQRTSNRRIAAAMALTIVLAACTATDDEGGDSTTSGVGLGSTAATTTVPIDAEGSWGTLTDLCKPGDATVDKEQNHGEGALNIGTGTDKGSTFVPGLLQEMWDASQSFVKWCNDEGGIQGLEINLVDLDAALFTPKPAINNACDKTFAMVGGGITFDDQEFPEFHDCGMIDFAGFTVTTAKAMSNGYIQPIPNPSNDKPGTWLMDIAELRPDDIAKPVIMYGNFATTVALSQQYKEQLSQIEGYGEPGMIEYNSAGESNWAPFAQRIKDGGYTWFTYVGTPQQLAQLLKAMDVLEYRPNTIVLEVNHYDQSIIDVGGTSAEGIIARTSKHAFEESEKWPAVQKFLDELNENVEDPHVGDLGLQTTSAWLMFVTAANACLESNAGVLERECVLAAGAAITDWDGGGLHSLTHPDTNLPPTCNTFLTVESGAWTRLYPEIGSPDDTEDGFHCREDGVQSLTGDYGKGVIDPDRPVFFDNQN